MQTNSRAAVRPVSSLHRHRFRRLRREYIVHLVCGHIDSDLFCPRCRYNLRGLHQPRCPECGLAFDEEQWQTRTLREHLPTPLDRCDPWQPHLVLLTSLRQLLSYLLHPRRLAATLDLRGPLLSARLMFLGGTLWIYLITALLAALASTRHTLASPAAALRFALGFWAPRAVLLALLTALLCYIVLVSRAALSVPRVTWRHHLRLAAHWLPAGALAGLLPLCLALLIHPALPVRVHYSWAGCIELLAVWTFLRPAAALHMPLRLLLFRLAVALLVLPPLWVVLWRWGLPRSMWPPLWVYG